METNIDINIEVKTDIEIDKEVIRAMYSSGHTLMMFKNIENMVIEFLEYMPLEYYEKPEDRKKIISPKLGHLLNNVGSEIDAFFRYWNKVHDKNLSVNINDLNFNNYKKIEEDLHLSDKEVILLHINKPIKPFNFYRWLLKEGEKEDEEKIKEISWWAAYNHIKHQGYYKKDEGNLENVINALGALFVVNCENEEVWKHIIAHDYIDKPYIATLDRPLDENIDIKSYYIYHPYVKSKLFVLKTRIEETKTDHFKMIF